MRKEHDFTKGVRGKFYRPGVVLSLPAPDGRRRKRRRRGEVLYGFEHETIEAKQDWFLTLTASERWDLAWAMAGFRRKTGRGRKQVVYERPILIASNEACARDKDPQDVALLRRIAECKQRRRFRGE